MDRADRGTKRICPTTGKKFYDLNREPVVSPYTVEIVPTSPANLFSRAAAPAYSRKAEEPEEDETETEGAEIVSLDDVEAEEAGAANTNDGDDDAIGIVEDDEATEDDTIIVDEDDDDDASGLIDVENEDDD